MLAGNAYMDRRSVVRTSHPTLHCSWWCKLGCSCLAIVTHSMKLAIHCSRASLKVIWNLSSVAIDYPGSWHLSICWQHFFDFTWPATLWLSWWNTGTTTKHTYPIHCSNYKPFTEAACYFHVHHQVCSQNKNAFWVNLKCKSKVAGQMWRLGEKCNFPCTRIFP